MPVWLPIWLDDGVPVWLPVWLDDGVPVWLPVPVEPDEPGRPPPLGAVVDSAMRLSETPMQLREPTPASGATNAAGAGRPVATQLVFTGIGTQRAALRAGSTRHANTRGPHSSIEEKPPRSHAAVHTVPGDSSVSGLDQARLASAGDEKTHVGGAAAAGLLLLLLLGRTPAATGNSS